MLNAATKPMMANVASDAIAWLIANARTRARAPIEASETSSKGRAPTRCEALTETPFVSTCGDGGAASSPHVNEHNRRKGHHEVDCEMKLVISSRALLERRASDKGSLLVMASAITLAPTGMTSERMLVE